MKKCKVISLVLLLFLVLAIALPASVAAQGGDPQDAIIKQVMEDTALHLGYSVSYDGTLVESPRTHYMYGVSSLDHRSNIIRLYAYSTESDAEFAWSQGKVTSENVYTETFRGYDAFYIQSTLTRYHFYVRIGRFVLITHGVGCSGPDKLSADVLYNMALQHGLFPPGGTTPTPTPTPDSDGDGVLDDVDQCLGTPAGVSVDARGCPIGMNLSVFTKKKTYSPGEIVTIWGSVWDAKGGLDGATVVVEVSGTLLSKATDPFGKYEFKFPIPSSDSLITYTVIAKASHSKYPSVSKSTSFSIGQKALVVKIRTDKKNYLNGETVKCTITVTDSLRFPVPDAELLVTATRLISGRETVLPYGSTNESGQYSCNFTWGKKHTGESIAEGKLKIEVKAEHLGRSTWEGCAPGYNSIIVSGCGDQECCEVEDCFVCPEDCKCGPEEICDPFSKHTKYTDLKTKCSSKIAYIFISTDSNLDLRHKEMMKPRIKAIKKFYEKEKYTVITVNLQGTEHEVLVKNKKTGDKIWVANEKEFATRLAKPSTKAIAFFGHGGIRTYNSWVPYGDTWIPTLGGHTANTLWRAVVHERKSEYKRLGLNEKDAGKKAMERGGNIELDYAYMFACHSLDDNSLRDFLVRKGGTYWGEPGTLYGICDLEKAKWTE
jgi:hypothetical protein